MNRWARVAVAVRIALAIVGGYTVAGAATTLLALTLPMARADAVTTATLLSFAIFAAAVLWAFAARSVARAALGLSGPTPTLGGFVWALHGGQV